MSPSAPGRFTSATVVSALICMVLFGVALASSTPGPSAFAVASGRLERVAGSVVAAGVASVGSALQHQVNASIAIVPVMMLPWKYGAVARQTVHGRFAYVMTV